MLNWQAIAFGVVLATIDCIVLPAVKNVSIGRYSFSSMIVPIFLYAIDPVIFLASLQYGGMVVMNILWDLISDVLVTVMGIFYFKEHLSLQKYCGLGFAGVAMWLLTGA